MYIAKELCHNGEQGELAMTYLFWAIVACLLVALLFAPTRAEEWELTSFVGSPGLSSARLGFGQGSGLSFG
jgi:hypothetical protein